jgi:hypothetical protein
MRPRILLASLLLFAVPAAPQTRETRISLGYAFSQYLETGGGNVPMGAYLSIAAAGRQVGFEADLGYHHDEELNSVTICIGPHIERAGSGKAKPFLHVLGGVRVDSYGHQANTSFGGMMGLGVDIPTGSKNFFRLGTDFQVFADGSSSLKTLRLNAGISF